MQRIVVGVDGSPGSINALRWALGQARRTGARLQLVNAWSYPYSVAPMAIAIPMPTTDEMAHVASSTLKSAMEDLGGDSLEVDVEYTIVEGSAAEALVNAAAGAALLVVGSRGLGGFSRLLLGSVSHHAAHHTPCPIVIVPHDWKGETE